MNKKKIDKFIPIAYEKLNQSDIVQEGKIQNEYRGYIDTFGAAVAMGSIISAIAFFMEKGKGQQDRTKLLRVMYNVIHNDTEKQIKDINSETNEWQKIIVEYVKANEKKAKEELINAAIAVKLAMNLYEIVGKKSDAEGKEDNKKK